MKYILTFWAFWPGTGAERLIVEPFDTLLDCEAAAERLWEKVQSDGATNYEVECAILEEMEV